MLKSRMKEHALTREIDLKFAKNIDELSSYIKSGEVTRLVVDLTAGVDFASSFAPLLLSQTFESFGVIAHVDIETQRAAIAAGFTQVIPRSILVRDLTEIIGPMCSSR